MAKKKREYSDNPRMQRTLSKWERLEQQGLCLVYPLQAWHARVGMTDLRRLQAWVDTQLVLSTSLINPAFIAAQRQELRRKKIGGCVFTGMPEALGVVLEVPPQNILKASVKPIRTRTSIGEDYYDLAHELLFDSSHPENVGRVRAAYDISTPKDLLNKMKLCNNEVLVMGKRHRRLHGCLTERINVKEVIVLAHGEWLSTQDQQLWLSFEKANWARTLSSRMRSGASR